MKHILAAMIVLVILFIGIPVVYGVGALTVELWQDMLPYSWTHTHSYSHGLHHHR